VIVRNPHTRAAAAYQYYYMVEMLCWNDPRWYGTFVKKNYIFLSFVFCMLFPVTFHWYNFTSK
jgi:hypothetical protein